METPFAVLEILYVQAQTEKAKLVIELRQLFIVNTPKDNVLLK
jgi:hypothetical protein